MTSNLRKVTGQNTEFLKEVCPNDKVKIEGSLYQVEKVVSNDCFELKSEPKPFKNQEFYLVPKLNQKEMYHEVNEKLSSQECLCLFPEGRSHESPGLIEIQPGVAKIIKEALGKNIPVKIQSVGINYSSPDQLRTSVYVCYGEVKEVTFKDSFYKEVLEEVKTSLEECCIPVESYEEMKLVLLIYKSMKVKTPSKFQVLRKIALSLKDIKHHQSKVHKTLWDKANYLFSQIEETNISFDFAEKPKGKVLALGILSLVSLPGMLIVWLASFYVDFMAETQRLRTLMNFKDRKEANDIFNSIRVVYILGSYPLYLLLVSFFVYLISHSLAVAFASYFCLPIYLSYSYKATDHLLGLKKLWNYLYFQVTDSNRLSTFRTQKKAFKEFLKLNIKLAD